ncbi:MAG: anaerobic ribonucleoside-triphosphate reductase [Candidatus Bathyarchaeia archaeon]
MLRSSERIGAGIFDAASAPVRLQILRLLSTKGPLQYTEIMFQLKLDPVRDAGKFVYHLKSLTGAGLVTLDKKTKRYEITELGQMIVSFARDMDEYVNVKRGKLYVRTSRLAIEEFHRNKIARSLVVEAGVPQEIADEIAAEAEDRLVRLKTTYLTSPLIREFVNAILIEKKFEEYRHKLTRLGMPVYDIAQLIRDAGERQLNADYVFRSAAKSVLSEYVLLNCLPHKLADAHLSGSIHIANLENWILKPNEVVHDVRYFLSNPMLGLSPPESLEAALSVVGNLLTHAGAEVSGEQTIEYFNTFLSPYARGRSSEEVYRALYYFFTSIRRDPTSTNPQRGFSISLDLDTPEFLRNEEAVGATGKRLGKYGDFQDEFFRLAETTSEVFRNLSKSPPSLLPHLLIRVRKHSFAEEKSRRLLESFHELAASRSVPQFELLNDNEKISYSATGLRLADDWTRQWAADCLRTGSMDTIFLNLPKLAYEARKDDEKLVSLLKERASVAIEGFKAKRKFIVERLKQPLLPLLAGIHGSAPYFYEKNAVYNLSFVGLSEAAEYHTGEKMAITNKRAIELALRILTELSRLAAESSDETQMRIRVSQRPGDEAAGRLTALDIEEYGRAIVIAEGARGLSYYSDLPTIPLSAKISVENRIELEAKFQSALQGGHLNLICTAPGTTSRALFKLTQHSSEAGCKFQTYTSNYTSCSICNQTDTGIIPRCPRCGSDRLVYTGRSSYEILPFNLWPEEKQKNADNRTLYELQS